MTTEPMTRANIFLPPEMIGRLKAEKARSGVPVAEFVRRAIEVALDADAQKDRIRKLRSGK